MFIPQYGEMLVRDEETGRQGGAWPGYSEFRLPNRLVTSVVGLWANSVVQEEEEQIGNFVVGNGELCPSAGNFAEMAKVSF